MNVTHTKHEIGVRGEKLAARHLKRQGYRILARNLHCGRNELDIIAQNKTYIVFVEVKTRSFDSAEEAALTRPSLAVHAEKRKRTLEAARQYLREHPVKRTPRMDVIEVSLDRSKRPRLLHLHHIEGAFDAKGRIV